MNSNRLLEAQLAIVTGASSGKALGAANAPAAVCGVGVAAANHSHRCELIPHDRLEEVDAVAKTAVWLASDKSDYITGTTPFIDGGMSLYPAFRDNG